MAKREFVDAHVHYYDMQHPVLHYGHWQPGVPHPFLGDQIQKLAERNFLAEDYIAETRNANVTKSVHVQAAMCNAGHSSNLSVQIPGAESRSWCFDPKM